MSVDLGLNLLFIAFQVYDAHSSYINNIALTSNFSNFGMPVDDYNTDAGTATSSQKSFTFENVRAYVVLGWSLFVAAMTSDQDLRTNLISRVHNRASFNLTGGVMPVSYDSTSGLISQGGAR